MEQKKQEEARSREEAEKNKYEGMVLIPAGEFIMGSASGAIDENPHKVYLDAYYIDKYEVTFEQYDKFCEATGRNKPSDSGWGRGNRPVINVSWDDATAYAKWAGKRLPTEAEWENACRAGSDAKYCFGDNESMLGEYAWYDRNSGSRTHPVGQKKPNAWGLYDMHGNVWEWCSDWYRNDYYKNSSYKNPTGANNGSLRVLRGGNWCDNRNFCRTAYRFTFKPDDRYGNLGFRCAASGARLETASITADLEPAPKGYSGTVSDEGEMVLIPAGEFVMGSASGESDENPPHKVYLDAYYIDKYEVTFNQYDKFCKATGRNKPWDCGWGRGNRPVINVSWDNATAYAKWAGKRLPTEAEWEKACRAGSNTKYCFGDSATEGGFLGIGAMDILGEYAWYDRNSGSRTHPVGQKKPNAWGLYDMHGNVWEWCSDWYRNDYYKNSPYKNPTGANNGSNRVLRCGGWGGDSGDCRSAGRLRGSPDGSGGSGGFRCAASDAQ